MTTTITEALASIKTTAARIQKKRAFVEAFLFRQDGIRDPHERDGGSSSVIEKERQGIADLEKQIVAFRGAIALANDETLVTINGVTRSIKDWLYWRREIAPGQKTFLQSMRNKLSEVRSQAMRGGALVLKSGEEATRPQDVIVNINEAALAAEIEQLEDTLGQLDGQLSLKNATTAIEV